MRRDKNGRFKKKEEEKCYEITISLPSFWKLGKILFILVLLFPWLGIIYRKQIIGKIFGLFEFLFSTVEEIGGNKEKHANEGANGAVEGITKKLFG